MNQDSGEILQEIINLQNEMEEKVKQHGGMLQLYKFSKQKHDVFLKVFTDMPFPCFFFDKNGDIAFANRLLYSLTGISVDDSGQRKESIFTYLSKKDAGEFEAAISDVFSDDPQAYYHELSAISILACDRARGEASKFTKAILYPLYDEADRVAFGAAVLLYNVCG